MKARSEHYLWLLERSVSTYFNATPKQFDKRGRYHRTQKWYRDWLGVI